MPDWTEHLRPRLAPLRLGPGREAEIVEELSQHLDQRYEELRHEGSSDADARRLAVEELLEPEALARHMRSLRQANVPVPIPPGAPGQSLFGDLFQDLRYAVRTLRKQPGFLAAAVLTLALGIGANSAIFALVDATVLRPLPFPDPERLVLVWEQTETSARERVSPLNLIDWRERSRTFESMGGYLPTVGGMVMSGADGTAETVTRQWVTAGFFDTFGVRPIVGRTFLPSDDLQRANAVVLSETFWRARFNADPGVVDSAVQLDGEPYTIVGVVPKEFQLLGRTSIWGLVSIQQAPPRARGVHAFHVAARVKHGVTLDAAETDLSAVAASLAREFPTTNAGRGVTLEPMHEALIGSELRLTAMLFLGVVGFVLLVCCVNVASLLLARATARARELAIRSALGASRVRVVRQLMTESLVLAAVGGAAGVAVGAAILAVAPSIVPQGLLPAAVTLAFDGRVVAFGAVTALLVGVLFGLAPAWQATELAPARVMASDSRTATGGSGRIRGPLVVLEVATAVVLLFGAGLLLRTMIAVENVDRGYRADEALTMVVDPLGSRYPTPAALLQFYEAVEREAATLPGVRGVAWASTLPLGRSYAGQSFFEIVGAPPVDESQRPTADYQVVSPGFFTTLDLPVVEGRAFNDRDRADGVLVCIVNEAFARRHVPGRSPIGLRLAMRPTSAAGEPPVVREIVGVARQVKGRPDETEDFVQIYVPLAQDTIGDIFMVVRPASGPAAALTPSVRAAIGRVDKEQLVSVRDVMTLEDVASQATSRHRFRAVLVMAFAGLALLLSMVGLFGILTYSVQERVREFGVRRALGATTAEVLRLVFRRAARVIVLGAVVGLAVSIALGRLLASVLFGVKPLDPTTFAAVTLVLAFTAMVSVVGPAWRAARIDPATALRGE